MPSNLPPLLLYNYFNLPRAMIFVDGENLAIGYGAMLKELGVNPLPEIVYRPNVLVWCSTWGRMTQGIPAIMRKYFYTSTSGGHEVIRQVEDEIKGLGIEAPRVFHKEKISKRTKAVDITLSTDMLMHAAGKHFDIAVLMSGDADYIPLIRAVQGQGARVLVWSLSRGLSPQMKKEADELLILDPYLFGT